MYGETLIIKVFDGVREINVLLKASDQCQGAGGGKQKTYIIKKTKIQ